MMNEFEVLKHLILDKELLEIMKFVSKTSVSQDKEIQEKRNEELNDFYENFEYDLFAILDDFPELLKNYGNNPHIYSKMIKVLETKLQ